MMMVWFVLVGLSLGHAGELGGSEGSTSTVESGIQKALSLLDQSESGKQILAQARAKNLSIQEGRISKTEIVATRVVQNQVERIDYSVQVILSHDKNPVFQAIDLAHELIHALHPKTNPFNPKLNAIDYIRDGIEGEGGEADAILQECRIGKELLSLVEEESAHLIKARCHYVWKLESDPTRWKLSFYHLGKHLDLFRDRLATLESDPKRIVRISRMIQGKDPMFTSAAANKPYPLALLDEYLEITQKICNRPTANPKSELSGELEERCQSLSSALYSPQ